MDWPLFSVLASGAALLVGRQVAARGEQRAAAVAAGLRGVPDLAHVSTALQRTALWSLSDGGFEQRPVHGIVSRGTADLAITAFDLETLRERRGEWAFLPVEPPFRIGGLVSVAICELPRDLPHVLFKRAGRGDELRDDDLVARANPTKLARDALRLARSYPADLPPTLSAIAIAAPGLPPEWRAYTIAPAAIGDLIAGGLGTALGRAGRRDLVVELIGDAIVVYPAARAVGGADALGDLAATAIALAEGVLAATPQLADRPGSSRV